MSRLGNPKKSAKPEEFRVPIDEREAAMEFLGYVDDVRSGKKLPPMPTGLTALDNLIHGLMGGIVLVIAGRPAMGKSALAKQLFKHTCSLDKSYCGYFNVLEMSPKQNAARTLSGDTRVSFGAMMRGKVNDSDMAKLWAASDKIAGGQFFLDEEHMGVERFRSKVRWLAQKLEGEGKKLKLVGLDYCQQMATYDGSREQNIAAISNMAKSLATELDVCFILCAQLNRELERRDDKRPVLADLRESGAIEQDADQVVMVYRPAVYQYSAPPEDAELIVRKNRWGETGTAEVMWRGNLVRFENQ